MIKFRSGHRYEHTWPRTEVASSRLQQCLFTKHLYLSNHLEGSLHATCCFSPCRSSSEPLPALQNLQPLQKRSLRTNDQLLSKHLQFMQTFERRKPSTSSQPIGCHLVSQSVTNLPEWQVPPESQHEDNKQGKPSKKQSTATPRKTWHSHASSIVSLGLQTRKLLQDSRTRQKAKLSTKSF